MWVITKVFVLIFKAFYRWGHLRYAEGRAPARQDIHHQLLEREIGSLHSGMGAKIPQDQDLTNGAHFPKRLMQFTTSKKKVGLD